MRLDHPIFHTPHEAILELTEIAAPAHYAHYAAAAVPGKLSAWKVFVPPALPHAEPGAAQPLTHVGLVSDGFGFTDTPDCEWISSGVNSKGPQSLALGRQANFFLWGFAADPGLFTDSAKAVFTNTICWMQKFAGHKALVAKVVSPREWVFVQLWVASKQKDTAPAVDGDVRAVTEYDKAAAERYFGTEAVAEHGGEYQALKAWYLDHFEAITSQRAETGRRCHVVDADVVALGASNRKLEFFDRVLARWKADAGDALCKRVLARYVPQRTFARPADLETWLVANRTRLHFTDSGGYRWIGD